MKDQARALLFVDGCSIPPASLDCDLCAGVGPSWVRCGQNEGQHLQVRSCDPLLVDEVCPLQGGGLSICLERTSSASLGLIPSVCPDSKQCSENEK